MTVQAYLMCMHGCRGTQTTTAKILRFFSIPFVKSCFTSYLLFGANPVMSLSLPVFFLLSACCLSLVSPDPGIAQVSVSFSCCPCLAAPVCKAHLKCC